MWLRRSINDAIKFITHVTCDSLYFSVRSVMYKYLEKKGDVTFDKIFGQKLGKCLVLLAALNNDC